MELDKISRFIRIENKAAEIEMSNIHNIFEFIKDEGDSIKLIDGPRNSDYYSSSLRATFFIRPKCELSVSCAVVIHP